MPAKEKAQLMVRLDDLGAARAEALDEASMLLDRIAEFAPQALAEGITKAEIARLARISRPTLDALLRGAA